VTTLIVVPTYNEAENLPLLAERLLARPEQSLLVVDDNSPDGTGVIAEGLADRWGRRARVLHRGGKLGLGTAYREGFRVALEQGPDFVVQMDGDFSHDPEDVPRLVAAAGRADVAIGSRYVKGGGSENWPKGRRLISRGGSLYTQTILGLTVSDPTSGFKCFRREALAGLDLARVQARGFGFQVEMNWLCHRAGLRLVEVPIRFVDRKLGRSKMSSRIFFEALLLVWQLRLQRPPSPPRRPPVTVR
jgi:dolichol-phosphate mannosyltransferase